FLYTTGAGLRASNGAGRTKPGRNWDFMVGADQDSETGGKPKHGLFKRLFGRGHEPAAPGAVASAPGKEPEAEHAPQGEPESTSRDEPAEVASAAPEPQEPAAPPPEEQPQGWWARLRAGLSRSSSSIGEGLAAIFTKRKLDAAMLEELEDVLIRADLGIATSARIAQAIGQRRYDKDIGVDEVKEFLAAEVERVLAPCAVPLEIDVSQKPFVILVVGVNGSGKTTTIGKLAAQLKGKGHEVLLAAGDTFRAAAIEQLCIWGERLGCPVIAREQGSDASALAFDAIKEARERGAGV